jgi:Ca-activated chloride channel family protein
MNRTGIESNALLPGLTFALVVAAVVSAPPALALRFTDRLHSDVEKGNVQYRQEENENALYSYMRAQRQDSTHAVPYFNAGDALYRLGRYDEGALQFFKSTKSEAESVASMGYYNLGNTFYRKGDMQSAAEAYRRSLLMNPDDEDAKHNLELVMRLMEEQQQQQDQQQDRQQQDQQQQDEQQQDQQRQSPEQREQEEQQDRDRPREREISEDELERILAAIDASDKETQEEIARQASRTRRVSGKDW